MLTESMEHLAAELQRLDLLLHREILRLRANYQLSLDEFRGQELRLEFLLPREADLYTFRATGE